MALINNTLGTFSSKMGVSMKTLRSFEDQGEKVRKMAAGCSKKS